MTNENITNKRNLNDSPQYFGVYLNMARHNLFMIANDINKKYDLNQNTPNEKLTQEHLLIKIWDKEDKRDAVYHHLKKLLPFIKIFCEEDKPRPKGESININNPKIDFVGLKKFMESALTELEELRNDYSHYFSYNGVGGATLDRKKTLDIPPNDFVNLFNNASLYATYNFTSTQRGIADTHKAEDFNHLKNYRLFESKNECSEKGLAFFICLFLEKQYAIIFLKRLQGFKNESNKPFLATLKAFTAYSIKLPHDKLDVGNMQEALLLDMLNELAKCPGELYNHLDEQERKKFIPELDNDAIENIISNSRLDDLDDEQLEKVLTNITSKKRTNDRFTYFALRFIEETGIFKNINLQISLGKILLRQYPKTIIGKQVDRNIFKEVNAFGKLSHFVDEEEICKENILTINGDKPADRPFFFNYSPHYNLNGNKIGLYLQDNNNLSLPTLEKDGDKYKIKQQQPTAFLSIHELPKLILLECLKSEDIKNTESIIIDFIQKQNELLNQEKLDQIKNTVTYDIPEFTRRITDISLKRVNHKEQQKREEYLSFLKERKDKLQQSLKNYKIDLQLNQLPQKVTDHLLNIKDCSTEKQAKQYALKVLIDLKQRLKNLRQNKMPKTGTIATFLAKDMISMVASKETKQKITSVYYNKLQNKIAYFGISQQDLFDLCDEMELFNKATGHVFLTKEIIFESTHIVEFYEKYISKKIKWLEHYKTKIGKVIPQKGVIPYSYKKQGETPKAFNVWLKNKQQLPILLPTGLFDQALNKTLQKKLGNNSKAKPDDKFSRLLSYYLKEDTQPFYKSPRVYNLYKEQLSIDLTKQNNFEDIFKKFAKMVISKKKKQRLCPPSEKEIIKRCKEIISENEKQIRYHQTKDRIIRIMCQQIILANDSIETGFEILLKNYEPNNNHNPLNVPVTFKQKLKSGKTIVAKDTDNNNTERGYQWTVKDFGFFKRFVHDRRIETLCNDYFDGMMIPIGIIQHQLRAYDKYRELFFDKIFELEALIVKKDEIGLRRIADNKNYNQVQFDKYLCYIKSRGIDFEENLIKYCRNKISHNEFIPINIFNDPNEFKINEKDLVISGNLTPEQQLKNKLNNSIIAKIYLKFEHEMVNLKSKIDT